jgi:hypothetical protein
MESMRLPGSSALALLLLVGFAEAAFSQTAPSTQPLNASVSDFGTSFVFDPPVICSGCIETELGFLADPNAAADSREIPIVLTLAPLRTHTDFSILVNALDSESAAGHRVTQFGNRFDFVIRQQALQKGPWTVTLGPRGAFFDRGPEGGRAGLTLAPQWGRGPDVIAANFTWTGAIGVSAANPRSDYAGGADWFHTLDHRGAAFFLGLQHEDLAGSQSIGTEAGFILPFRNGQVELASQQLNLNTSVDWQFQARVIVNWGNLLLRHASPAK